MSARSPAKDGIPESAKDGIPERMYMPTLIVTGGGRGIGAAVARLAATRGYAVAVNYDGSPNEFVI
jgi:predicted Rossmann-fold nucleotide-binding protein